MDGSKSKKVAKRASATRGVAKAAAQSLDPKEVSRRIDEAIASLGDWRGEKMAEIRKLIHEVDPRSDRRLEVDGNPRVVAQGDVRPCQRP